MVQDTHIARNNFILQYGTSRYINTITMIGNNNDSTLKRKEIKKNKICKKLILLIYLTLKETPRPKVTSPDTVK